MIVVRVELHSAITGKTTELARMNISNRGDEPSPEIGNYTVHILRGRSENDLDLGHIQRCGAVLGHRRLDKHVWSLVSKALKAVEY